MLPKQPPDSVCDPAMSEEPAPFAAPSNPRILRESDTVAQILRKVDAMEFEIMGSSVLLAEIAMITPKIKEETVLALVRYVAKSFAGVTEKLKN